jgi:competence protein ComEC
MLLIQRAEILFVVILFPLVGGILSAGLLNSTMLTPLIFTTTLFYVLLCIYNAFYGLLHAHRFKKIGAIFCYIQLYLIGALLATSNKQLNYADHFSKKKSSSIKVVIDSEPQQKGIITRFSAKVVQSFYLNTTQEARGRIIVACLTSSISQPFEYGDELLVKSNYTTVEPPFNPAEFDVRFWLATQNIYHQCFLKKEDFIKISSEKGNAIISYALKVRKRQITIYKKLIKNEEAFAVASTLILGYRSDLSAETLQAYAATGTIHALSVSGMHVGIIYMILDWLLSYFLNRNKGLKLLKVITIIFLIWYYSLITGFCPAVLRSAIMLTVFILAKSFHKHSNGYNIMGFSAFLLLVWNPMLIYDVGFQLSFISVFGLIYLQPKIYSMIYMPHKVLDKLWSIIALSLAAQLVTFPLSIYYFHQFPIYFLLGNLFVMLPITVLMYLGLAILLFKAYFLAPVFEIVLNFTNSGLAWISKIPYSSLTNIWITKTELILLSLAILIFLYAFSRREKYLLYLSLSCLLLFEILLTKDKIDAGNQRRIVFFSLRKNYAAAFITGNKATLITDLNPNEKSFIFSIKSLLDQYKIEKVEFYDWNSKLITSSLKIEPHEIKFYNYSILKFDDFFNHKIIINRPAFNIIWLHSSPSFIPQERMMEVDFKHIIADAGNKEMQLKIYKKSFNIFHLDYHILKKKKAYLIDLNN